MVKFTIGCDPEIFLVDQQQKYKSVIGLLGANKWHPKPLTTVGHAVLEDNVAVEFNIPPCATSDDFLREIRFTMGKIKELLPADLEYSTASAVSFPESELNCEQAWVFGCDPDYDAWKMEENPKPCADDRNLRSCGGHIHVGSDLAVAHPVEVVRAMDLFLGVGSVNLDSGVLRRKLYGKAGAFRIKDYGVEYRTLSNFWIFSDELVKWAYEGTKKALEFVHSGRDIPANHADMIQDCINNNNKDAYDYLKQQYAV